VSVVCCYYYTSLTLYMKYSSLLMFSVLPSTRRCCDICRSALCARNLYYALNERKSLLYGAPMVHYKVSIRLHRSASNLILCSPSKYPSNMADERYQVEFENLRAGTVFWTPRKLEPQEAMVLGISDFFKPDQVGEHPMLVVERGAATATGLLLTTWKPVTKGCEDLVKKAKDYIQGGPGLNSMILPKLFELNGKIRVGGKEEKEVYMTSAWNVDPKKLAGLLAWAKEAEDTLEHKASR